MPIDTIQRMKHGLTVYVLDSSRPLVNNHADDPNIISFSGINYTGLYGNPIVAWACTFNCVGLSHIGHLSVYWLSPLIGWYLAEWCFDDNNDHLE